MHTVIGFSGLALVITSSYIQWKLLLSIPAGRRHLSFLLLALLTPPLILGVLFTSFCWQTISGLDGHIWDDHSLIHLLAWSLAIIAVIASMLSLARGILPAILVRRYPQVTDLALINLARRVADRVGVRCPTLRVYNSARPVVALCGAGSVGGQTILISRWVLSNLDEEEKEAVLAHEMAHLRRRDGLVVGVAQLIRNISFYVPGLWRIWHRLRFHMEVMCDELAVKMTGQRLALASALCKAGQQALCTRTGHLWAVDSGLLGIFSGLSNLRERVTLLMAGSSTYGGREETKRADVVTKSMIVLITLQGVLVTSVLHFLDHGELYGHVIMLALLLGSGLFWAAMFLRFFRKS